MGPALIEPDHLACLPLGRHDGQAAMGPALIEPDHSRPPAEWCRRCCCRNGAGSHRAGSPAFAVIGGAHLFAAMGPALIEPDHRPPRPSVRQVTMPQWGRLSSSRIT